MKFAIVNEEELHGKEALLQHLKNTKRPSDVTGKECPTCKGWGKVFKGEEHEERITCPTCKGAGIIKEEHVEFFPGECPTCLGSGYVTKRVAEKKPWPTANKTKVIKSTCPKCKGKGEIKEDTTSGSFEAGRAAGLPAFQNADGKGNLTIATFPMGSKQVARRIQPKKKKKKVIRTNGTIQSR